MTEQDFDMLRDALNDFFKTRVMQKQQFVEYIQCDPSGFSKFLNKKRPSFDLISCRRMILFLQGKTSLPLPEVPPIDIPDLVKNEKDGGHPQYFPVPICAAVASMGGGSFENSKRVTSYISFKEDFLYKKTRNLNNLVFILTSGTSMSPTIAENAMVLVDLGQKEPLNNKVFYVMHNNMTFVKRVEVREGKPTALISDNGGEPVPIEEQDSFEIIGRVLLQQSEV